MNILRGIILALMIICSFYCQQTGTGQGVTVVSESESIVYNGSAIIRVDDELIEFKIGDVSIPFTRKLDFTYAHVFPQLKISPNDVISIKGKNIFGVFQDTNPAGILASISYYIGNNKFTITTSSLTWKCNNDTPMNVANNDGSKYYSILKELPTTAQNIWAFDYQQEVTCIYDPKNLQVSDTTSFIGSAYINVDNELLEFKVGDKSIAFKNIGGDHTYVHFFPQIKIKSTDKISITAKNWENWNWDWNPASIMSTIKYTNNLGQVVSINTSGEWICNGLGAMTMLNNVRNKWWPAINGIDLNAQHVWNVNLSPVCTCIYDPVKKTNAFLTARFDDELLEFWVNGERKDFFRFGNNWTATYKFSFYYETGQQIKVVAKNQNDRFSNNNPASILITITYNENDGSVKKINTNDTEWKCNGAVPMNLGPNIRNRWWPEVPGVERTAQNIWGADSAQITTCVFN